MTSDPRERARRERRRRAASRRARRRGLFRLAVLIASVGLAAILVVTLSGGSDHKQSGAGVTTEAHQKGGAGYHVPPLPNPHDVYAADRPGRLSPVVRNFPSRVYVPNSESNTVSVIDPKTFK